MVVAVLLLALQMRAPALADTPQRATADSARDLRRALGAQASFERARRTHLPYTAGSGGRCDVRLGRFCWWYDGSTPTFPPEAEAIGRRRGELLAELDQLAAKYPGDDLLAGLRVHYRVDARAPAAADSVARQCHASPWWCAALVGYAAHARGDGVRADSAFAAAVALLPPEQACAWRDIAPLLNDDDREVYEHRPCEARDALETRYWLFSRPQFATPSNEWRNEFHARRVLNWLGARAETPHLMRWGNDAAELVLRYGWPTAWSRYQTSVVGSTDPGIVGHDPSPSYSFAPASALRDSLRAFTPDAWDLDAQRSEARYAPPLVKRVARASLQVARFRRGDSTLVVGAYAATDDSLLAPVGTFAVAGTDGVPVVSAPDTVRVGRVRVMLGGTVLLAGAEVTDTARRFLARTRLGFVPAADSGRLALSDLLVYRAGDGPAASLDSALVRAIPGDTASRTRPIGLFWETYGVVTDGEPMDVAVSVERVDHSWIRSTRQRLGLTPVDTPIRIQWSAVRPPGERAASNAISLDLANLDTGRYRVTLRVVPLDGAPVSTTREIELLDR
jgi:hypothetical protein